MYNKLYYLFILSLLSSFGCAKQPNIPTDVKVDKCSYTDEYFDYCTKENILKYKESIKKLPVNFNKNYILLPVNGGDNSYSGIVAIDKNSGHVDTMLFGFKKKNEVNQIVSEVNSDMFCINGEINSKSLSITKSGKNCFKFNHNGFSLIKEVNDVTVNNLYPILFDKLKFKCGSNQCKFLSLNTKSLNKISRGDNNSSLRFIINERGFDSSYIDASDDKNILYVIMKVIIKLKT